MPSHSAGRRRGGLARLGCLTLTLLTLLTLLGGATVWMTRDRDPVGHFDDVLGRAEYLAAYDTAMTAMPEPREIRNIVTRFGVVRASLFSTPATASRTPFVLLPGRSAATPMWAANLPALMRDRPVWAIDTLGDAGRSEQTVSMTSDADQVAWLDEALGSLGGPRVHLVGHSFGGYLATRYAVAHPERLASLTLLEPVYVFAPLAWRVIALSLPASLPFLPASWREGMLAEIGGTDDLDPNDPLTRMIDAAMRHYRPALPTPSLVDDDDLRRLRVPTLALLGSASVMHDSATGVRRGRALVSDIVIEEWSGATHSLPMEAAARVDARILTHADAHDGSAIS